MRKLFKRLTFEDAFKNENRFVKQMIYCETRKEPESRFGVYLDRRIDVDWKIEGDIAKKVSVDPQRKSLSRILCEIGALEAAIHNWPADLKLRSKRLLCEGLACMLRGDAHGSSVAMARAREFINERSPQVSRYWILRSCLIVAGLATMAAIVMLRYRAWLASVIGPTSFALIMSFCAGCVGALLFVVLQLGKQPLVKAKAERRLHWIEAVARIVVGGVAGVMLAGVLKVGLFSPFGVANNGIVGMCLIAMIAGASERLAAGIVTKVESAGATQQPHVAKVKPVTTIGDQTGRATTIYVPEDLQDASVPNIKTSLKQSGGTRSPGRVKLRKGKRGQRANSVDLGTPAVQSDDRGVRVPGGTPSEHASSR